MAKPLPPPMLVAILPELVVSAVTTGLPTGSDLADLPRRPTLPRPASPRPAMCLLPPSRSALLGGCVLP